MAAKQRTKKRKTRANGSQPEVRQAVMTDLALLHDHPRNYQTHPDDQIEHLAASLRQYGMYRNILCARDHTILAGHGIAKAARLAGFTRVPVVLFDLDPNDPRALKLLAADNEISNLSERDDRALTVLLREVLEQDDDGLMGTGLDEQMLALLVMVTRPKSKIESFSEAAAWVGMPEFGEFDNPIRIVVSFKNMNDRADFIKRLKLKLTEKSKATWWPPLPERDNSVKLRRFEG